MTFSGKDTSCYCPESCILDPMKLKTHKNTHARGLRGSELPHLIFSRLIFFFFRAGQNSVFTSSPVCLGHSELISAIYTHAWAAIELSWNAPYEPVFLSLTAAQLTSVLTVDSTKNKQQLARRNCRKTFVFIKWIRREQVCFAGSGCLPLSPWPRAAGPFQSLAGRVEKGGGLAVNWIHWH